MLWMLLGPQKYREQLYSTYKLLKRNDEERSSKGEKLGHYQGVDWSCDPVKASRLGDHVT